MGKKIPFWQCILVMLVMVATLYWSIVKDACEKPHIALMISAYSQASLLVPMDGNGHIWSKE